MMIGPRTTKAELTRLLIGSYFAQGIVALGAAGLIWLMVLLMGNGRDVTTVVVCCVVTAAISGLGYTVFCSAIKFRQSLRALVCLDGASAGAPDMGQRPDPGARAAMIGMPQSLAWGKLAMRQCASCGAYLVPGPRGGAAQNFYCSDRTKCRQGFNLTFANGLLVFHQPIGEVSDETYAHCSKKK